jgi:hypothetical protein
MAAAAADCADDMIQRMLDEAAGSGHGYEGQKALEPNTLHYLRPSGPVQDVDV